MKPEQEAVADDLIESANALVEAIKNRDDNGALLLWQELGERQFSVTFTIARLFLRSLGE